MGESYRKWRVEYGPNWEQKFRERYESDMMKNDTHLYVGTVHRHPNIWIVVGLFFPPKGTERLFDTVSSAL